MIALSPFVSRIFAMKKSYLTVDMSALESEIDQLVYKLYGLTDEEIAIVEGKRETKQEPRDKPPAASPRRRRQSSTPATPAPTDDEVLE